MFRTVPVFGADQRSVAEVLRNAMIGKTNNTGTITLATGGALTTTLSDERISPNSKIVLIPFSDAAKSDSIPFAELYCTTSQSAAVIDTAYPLSFNTAPALNGVTLTDTSHINVLNAGEYSFNVGYQLQNTDNVQHEVSIWFRKNGTDIAYSNRLISVPARKSATIFGFTSSATEVFADLAANDYLEVVWSTSSTSVTFFSTGAQFSPTRPVTPCKSAMVKYISAKSIADVYVGTQEKGSATVLHFANSTEDKTYAYIVIG